MIFNKLATLIQETSLALLQAKEGESNLLLSQVFDEFLVVSPAISPQALSKLTQVMTIMHEAQQRRDYVYLVDLLMYEIPLHINLKS